jgi:radical SAM-linked protein
MIGLPSETEADVLGIALLAERVKRAAGGRLKVSASVSTFVPKPHTPFQWAAQLSIEDTEARQALLRRELGRRGIEFRWHDSRLSWLEGLFSRGDRRLADVLETAQRRGARFDGWSDHCRMDVWTAALAEHGLDPADYLRRRALGEVLPWDHLDAGVSSKFLQKELARAVEGLLTPDCSIERCTYCGACDFKTVRNVDYHPEGAKGSLHRGQMISRWAELLVPAADGDASPQWETRTWRDIRARVAARRAAREPAASARAAALATPLPSRLAPGSLAPAPATGEGNAEEWLGAVPSSLAPAAEAAVPVERVRLRYRKTGPARFIGTRELGTIFARAARRAGLPLAYSQGHHPLPRVAFGPALAVGFSSEDEYVDLELTEPLPPPTAAARLASELPEGLEPVGAAEVPRSAPSIDADVASFVYEVDLDALEAPPAPPVLAAAVARFRAATTFPVQKRGKAGTRIVDGRRLVSTLELTAAARLMLEVVVGRDGTLKPEAVVGALLELSEDACRRLRVHKVATRFHRGAAALSPC